MNFLNSLRFRNRNFAVPIENKCWRSKFDLYEFLFEMRHLTTSEHNFEIIMTEIILKRNTAPIMAPISIQTSHETAIIRTVICGLFHFHSFSGASVKPCSASPLWFQPVAFHTQMINICEKCTKDNICFFFVFVFFYSYSTQILHCISCSIHID